MQKLIEELNKQTGEFYCEAIDNKTDTKIVEFKHIIEPPYESEIILKDTTLKEFYSAIGSLTLFYCSDGEEAAFYISHPSGWELLELAFDDWVDMLDEDEEKECLPDWFGEHKVIGEIPSTGNYILTVTEGNEKGAVYTFDHDGFEFEKLGDNITEFIRTTINPNSNILTGMASHMRFISGNSYQQWWIKELRHNSGDVVVTNL